MRTREDLQKKLVEIIGNNNVYFQPPSNIQMKYPAIRYQLDSIELQRADNLNYSKFRSYAITHIYKSLSNELTDKMINSFQSIRFVSRMYVDGLYNDRYELIW